MRKIYAGFIAQQIENGNSVIALEADLMSSMAMDSVARDYPQYVINCGIMEANVIGTAAGLALTGRKPFVHTLPHLPVVAVLISSLCRLITSVLMSK